MGMGDSTCASRGHFVNYKSSGIEEKKDLSNRTTVRFFMEDDEMCGHEGSNKC